MQFTEEMSMFTFTACDLIRKGFDMRLRKPRVAERDEVSVSRKGEIAVNVYRDDATAAVNQNVGPKLEEMSDHKLVEVHNGIIRFHILACTRVPRTIGRRNRTTSGSLAWPPLAVPIAI